MIGVTTTTSISARKTTPRPGAEGAGDGRDRAVPSCVPLNRVTARDAHRGATGHAWLPPAGNDAAIGMGAAVGPIAVFGRVGGRVRCACKAIMRPHHRPRCSSARGPCPTAAACPRPDRRSTFTVSATFSRSLGICALKISSLAQASPCTSMRRRRAPRGKWRVA
jgi:hypothetical protein